MKKAIILLILFVVSNASAIAAETLVIEQPKPKYGKRKGGQRLTKSIFKVKITRFNSKIRTKHDNEKKKTFGKKGKKGLKAHNKKSKRVYKMRY